MEALTDFLNAQPAWHWWALGAILLAAEIASTTQYLLWPGLAALLVGVLKFVVPPMDGRLSVFLFAVFAVVATVLWKRSSLGPGRPARPRITRSTSAARNMSAAS